MGGELLVQPEVFQFARNGLDMGMKIADGLDTLSVGAAVKHAKTDACCSETRKVRKAGVCGSVLGSVLP